MLLRKDMLALGILLVVGGQLFTMDASAALLGYDLASDRLAVAALCESICAEESAKHAARLRLLERSSKLVRDTTERNLCRSKSGADDHDGCKVDKIALHMSKAVDAAFKRRLELIQNIKDTASSLEDARAQLSGLEDLETELCLAICKDPMDKIDE